MARRKARKSRKGRKSRKRSPRKRSKRVTPGNIARSVTAPIRRLTRK